MIKRLRRLRKNPNMRALLRETKLSPEDFIYPLFVIEGEDIKEEIPSMPGIYHFSVDKLDEEIKEIEGLGIRAVLLFGLPAYKDETGSCAYDNNGVVQRGIRAIKAASKELVVITDVCLCQYTSHGHCGILDPSGYVLNDETLVYLQKIALSHANAGADIVAPSDMMDGHVAAIRNGLDQHHFEHVAIMSYSAKYASNFYGPFRDAVESAPSCGDRKSHQLDYGNASEAMRKIGQDIDEGADIIIVKPAMAYLDIIRQCRDTYNIPLCAYQVSGEYAMLMNAVKQGLADENIFEECLISAKRAGAQMIISYAAKEFCRKLKEA